MGGHSYASRDPCLPLSQAGSALMRAPLSGEMGLDLKGTSPRGEPGAGREQRKEKGEREGERRESRNGGRGASGVPKRVTHCEERVGPTRLKGSGVMRAVGLGGGGLGGSTLTQLVRLGAAVPWPSSSSPCISSSSQDQALQLFQDPSPKSTGGRLCRSRGAETRTLCPLPGIWAQRVSTHPAPRTKEPGTGRLPPLGNHAKELPGPSQSQVGEGRVWGQGTESRPG